MHKKNIAYSFIYFSLSTIITWYFIKQADLLYVSQQQMLLSCAIAGSKWGIQIVAALLFLKEKKWEFIKSIAFTCFVGSCILLPYCFFEQIRLLDKSFLISLLIAVFVMIVLYYNSVIRIKIEIKWFWAWITCLAIAVSLQIFLVFKII